MPHKSTRQNYTPNSEQTYMMETFRQMVNHCIRIGLENNCSTLKKLSLLSYQQLKEYPIPSIYKLTAISQAAGRLAQMKKDIRKGKHVKSPFVRKPYLVSCYAFKINGMLLSFPVKNREFANILLTDHTVSELSKDGVKVKSFTITPTSLSISIQKDVTEIKPDGAIGIDRNLRNITISTPEKTIMYRTEKILSIKENSQHVRASFRRSDRRVKNRFFTKIRGRQTRRVNQILHKISKHIVEEAKKTKSVIVFEDLGGIRRLYKKGNGQGNNYRRKLNSWSFYELQRQVEYKAKWEGIPVKFVDPGRTSKLCPVCGDRIQEDRLNRRKLLCINCNKMMDRDVVASMNIGYKGWARFIHPGGLPDEAMRGNADRLNPLNLRVHGSKLVSVTPLMQQNLELLECRLVP
ncbi:MAG: RNA-guided endonuclease InsQ/TnpB family protein [Candidatus Nitrosotenuis sp.]